MSSAKIEAAARVIADKLGAPNYDADDWGVFASVASSALKAAGEVKTDVLPETAQGCTDEIRMLLNP